MLASRPSDAATKNPELKRAVRKAGETNLQWLSRQLGDTDLQGWIVLIGGRSLVDFRLRVAQSHLRDDLVPSHWSHTAVISGSGGKVKGVQDFTIHEISLEPISGFRNVPKTNAVQESTLSRYDDPKQFPNIACISFPADPKHVEKGVQKFRKQRSYLDSGALIIEWLAFAWGAGQAGNPLLREMGIPSAAFVESVFNIAGTELTPGLSSRASCPEAIWQSAKWWHKFYKSAATSSGAAPQGIFVIGQNAEHQWLR